MRHTAYYAGFAGADPVYGRQIARLESWGAGGLDPDWASASPCLQANLPQIRLEPILKARAEALAPGRVRFHHELVDFATDAEGVIADVRDKDAGRDLPRARPLPARVRRRAHGGAAPRREARRSARSIPHRQRLHERRPLALGRRPDVLIRWLWLPDGGAMGVLVPMGPRHWGPESEEWVFHLNYENRTPARSTTRRSSRT